MKEKVDIAEKPVIMETDISARWEHARLADDGRKRKKLRRREARRQDAETNEIIRRMVALDRRRG
jgi:hypothetical protein